MNHVERFNAVMNFQPVDRLPVIEWASWWHLTMERWRSEGLPAAWGRDEAVDGLGLDPYRQRWVTNCSGTLPEPKVKYGPRLTSMDEYLQLKRTGSLYPAPASQVDEADLRRLARQQAAGDIVFWITLQGFFWFPRVLLGVEDHLMAFYDQPELMHQINADNAAYQLRLLDYITQFVTPTYMTFAEDLSYNHGPMLSPEQFRQFMLPYYRQVTPRLHEMGTWVFVDSDGEITPCVPWFEEAGIQGVLPCERQAGVDLAALRAKHPRFRVIGGFDKMVMDKGPAAVRGEFERLLPVMRSGGYIPSCDHQTPPAVSLEQYREYVAMLGEYARRANPGAGGPSAAPLSLAAE